MTGIKAWELGSLQTGGGLWMTEGKVAFVTGVSPAIGRCGARVWIAAEGLEAK